MHFWGRVSSPGAGPVGEHLPVSLAFPGTFGPKNMSTREDRTLLWPHTQFSIGWIWVPLARARNRRFGKYKWPLSYCKSDGQRWGKVGFEIGGGRLNLPNL